MAKALLEAAEDLETEYRASSSHALFLPEYELDEFTRGGFTVRHSLSFTGATRATRRFRTTWRRSGKRRRQILRERRQLEDGDLEISHLTGDELLPEHAESMYEFYLATLDGKWGVPYLNRAFFDEVFRTMKDRTLLVLARDRRKPPRRRALLPQGQLALRPLLGRFAAKAQPALRTVLLPGYRLRHQAGLRTPGGRRPGRAQAGARLPSLTYSAQDEGSGFRTLSEST